MFIVSIGPQLSRRNKVRRNPLNKVMKTMFSVHLFGPTPLPIQLHTPFIPFI